MSCVYLMAQYNPRVSESSWIVCFFFDFPSISACYWTRLSKSSPSGTTFPLGFSLANQVIWLLGYAKVNMMLQKVLTSWRLRLNSRLIIEFYYFFHETSEKKHPPGLHFIFPPPIVTIKMIPNLRSLCCFWQMIKLGVIPPLGRETAAWIIQQQTEWLLKCEKETLLALPGKEADATKKNRLLFISLSSSSRDVSPPFLVHETCAHAWKEMRKGGVVSIPFFI